VKTLIQVVPRLSPAVDGVGDYAMVLADSLRATQGITTVFLVAERLAGGRQSLVENGFAVVELESRGAEYLSRALARMDATADGVLLHYVGYGYREGGRPVWLMRGIEAWRRESKRPLLVFFHELFAAGWPWRRAFWTSFGQRRIFERLVALADAMATSNRLFALAIERRARRNTPLIQLPVPSNVGEPAAIPSWNTRANELVIFGGLESRMRIYAAYHAAVRAFCAVALIERVWDVGPGVLKLPSLPCPIEAKGVLASAEISALLLTRRYGGVSGIDKYLAKSGVFAAYASHGATPVNFERGRPTPGVELSEGVHYMAASDFSPQCADAIASEVHRWYAGHGIAHHGAAVARLLSQVQSVQPLIPC
jgi:hypothetical protein